MWLETNTIENSRIAIRYIESTYCELLEFWLNRATGLIQKKFKELENLSFNVYCLHIKKILISQKTTEKPQIRTNDIPTTVIHQTWAVKYRFNVEIDMVALLFFIGGLMTRFYRLSQPKHIVWVTYHVILPNTSYVILRLNVQFFTLFPPSGSTNCILGNMLACTWKILSSSICTRHWASCWSQLLRHLLILMVMPRILHVIQSREWSGIIEDNNYNIVIILPIINYYK